MGFLADNDDNDYDEAISNFSCDQYGESWTWTLGVKGLQTIS